MRQCIIYFLLLGVLKIAAQNPIDIQVEIAEPYPTELEYYLQNAQNLFIVVTNTSGIEQKIYYQVRLVGINNGFDAQTSLSAKPMEPVTVPTYGALFYSGQELEKDFAFSYPEDVVLNSVTPEQLNYITFNRVLPEGTYQLCITARDYNTDIALNFQCSDEFTISYGDIPIIYMPFQDEIIPANGNTHVTIGWEPPFTLAPPTGTFSYKLKMVDITDDPFGDIELLMNNPGIYPMLDAEDIPHEVYNYDFPPEIELIEGHQYALRVQATDNTGTFPISNNGYSEIVTFWYGFNPNDGNENGNTSTEQPAQNASDCFQNCYYEQQISTTPAASLAAFSEIQVGNFTIQALNFTNNNSTSASGTGTIEIPLLNNIKVNVAFSNLSINGNGRVYSGLVSAVVDKVYDPTQMTSSISEEMNNFIRNGRVVAGLLNGQGSIGLPLGLVQNIAGHNFMLGFTQMSFGPKQATCQLMQNLHIPQLGEQGWVSMAMSDVCLIPAGFAGEYALHPVNDYNIPSDGDLTYIINGSTATDPEDIKKEATYLEMDCNGLKSFGLRGQIHFPESTLKKENAAGEIQEGRVIGTFATQFDRAVAASENIYAAYGAEGLPEEAGLHFMVEVDMEPFQIAGVQGWGFETANAWLDVSDFENPPGIKWPASYDDANITIKPNGKAEMQPTWTGIFIQEMELKTPPAFMGGNRRAAVSVNNMIIDPLVTITIAAKDLIGKGEGDVDGWSLSMDSLFMTIVQNRIESGGFSGLLGMPITKENTYLRYTALIEDSNTQNTSLDPPSYIFSVRPENDLEFPFMIAKASLSQNSYVLGKFTHNNAEQTYFETFLEGGVGISSELFETDGDDIPLTIPVVDFQLKYHSQDGFTESHFGFCEQLEAISGTGCSDITYNTNFGTEFSDENFAGFPINIESAGLSAKSPTEFTFNVTPRVSLAGKEGGIAGSVGIDIDSEYKTVRGEKKLQLKGMGVSSMHIYSETQGLTLEGEVEFYNDMGSDNVGNKGARGGLQVMLPMGLGVKLKAEFGRSVSNAEAEFGSAQNYNYWYLDGMAYFAPAGIPIAPAVGIYGIGGGIYVNMSRGSNAPMSQSEVNSMLGSVNQQPSSGAVMVEPVSTGNLPFPSFGSYGLKMATTLGTFPTEAALNMDVSIYAQFSKNTGINMIEIAGDAFLFTPLSMRSKANFWASANFKWEKVADNHNVFDGLVDVYVNVSNVLYGNANNGNKMVGAAFHAEQGGDEEWYFYAGTADDRATLNLKLPLLPATTMQAYLMTGHGLPTDLPIPDAILQLMAKPQTGEGKNKLTDSTPIKANSEKRSAWDEQLANSGTGIAFGSEVSVGFGFDAKLIYAKLTGTLGFDINITQDENRTCYISSQGNITPGINGWYARGQVYAGVEGAIGIQFKFAGKDYDLNLFTLGAAMMLSGGGPDPFWVEGRAGIYYSVLNGLVDGNKSFDLTVGNRCVPAFEDPFGGLEIIYENYPALDEKDVSVFVDPSVNFILPIDEAFTLPIMDTDGSTKDMTVILQIDHFFVKERDGATITEKSQTLDHSHQTVTIEFDQILVEKKYHDAEIKIIGYERKLSGDIRLKDANNANWYEERKWAFKTGQTPYPIPDEEVVKTLPIRRQRFYLQEDNILRLATIEFSRNMKDNDPNTGYFPEDNDTWDYTYSVRWQGLDGGEAITRTLSDIENKLSINQVNFSVPVGLSNSNTYSCQLVRKQVRKGIMNNSAANGLLSGFSTKIVYDKNDKTNEVSSSTNVNIEIPAIPGQVEQPGEDIIYQFYFRTSQYNKMQEKLLASTFETVELGGATTTYLDVKVWNDEGFDVFEIKGELENGDVITAPRLLIEANESDLGAVGNPNSGFQGFCSMLRDAYYDFDRKTKIINDRDHDVTYSLNVGGYVGTATKTLYNLRESIDYALSMDHNASKITFQYNDWITDYKGILTDREINTEWDNTVSGSSSIWGQLGQSPGSSSSFSNFSSEFIRIPVSQMHSVAAADAVKMWLWSSNIEAKMHNVTFTKTYRPPGSPIDLVYSGTHYIHKWRTYMAAELPGFLDAVGNMSVSERGRYDFKNNLGFYKFSFENNMQYGAGHTPGYRLVKSALVD